MAKSDGDPRLYEMNPTGRFSDRAADYVRFRPGYPREAIDAILAGLLPPVFAADVGAGTGISARALADAGVHVLAIEPNAAMRAAAAAHARVEWRDGTAEATGLAAASVTLVVCAQAFHWFRPREALAEFARILAPGGRLAIVWNAREHADPLTRGYIEAIRAVGGEHPAEQREFEPVILESEPRLGPARELRFAHAQELDAAGLLGRATSASYAPREGPALAALRERLDALHREFAAADGRVRLRYVTRLLVQERRGPDA